MPASSPATSPKSRFPRRDARASVTPISQVHLRLTDKESPAFEAARNEILKYIQHKAKGRLPDEAWEGHSFSRDEYGVHRVDAVALDDPARIWTLRFDDDDKYVVGRRWVIEATLAEDNGDGMVLFEMNLQCIAHGENPVYDHSVPTVVRNIVGVCAAKLDGRHVALDPWEISTEHDVANFVEFLRRDRTADVVAVSLPDNSTNLRDALINCVDLAQGLAGAAHVAVIAGPAVPFLNDEIGSEFSVFAQGVRTYHPGFNPDTDELFAHPVLPAQKIRDWRGGSDACRKSLASQSLRRTVEGPDVYQRLLSFHEAKREADKRLLASHVDSSVGERLAHALEENDRLLNELAALDQLREAAQNERQNADDEVQRLQGSLFFLQERIESLQQKPRDQQEPQIPQTLGDLESWAQKYLSGSVEIRRRAIRAVGKSEFENVELVYQSLLLLRDYYVPMRRAGGPELMRAYEERCQELHLEETSTFKGNRAHEFGDNYFIQIGAEKKELDRHLKQKNVRDPRRCFRLYFLWDDDTRQVVVGWLPSHLPTRIS